MLIIKHSVTMSMTMHVAIVSQCSIPEYFKEKEDDLRYKCRHCGGKTEGVEGTYNTGTESRTN